LEKCVIKYDFDLFRLVYVIVVKMTMITWIDLKL